MICTELTERSSLLDLAISSSEIESQRRIRLRGSVITSNLAATNPVFARHLAEEVYISRVSVLDAISLVHLPRTTLFGGGHFIAACDDRLISEQYPPYVGTLIPQLSDVTKVERPLIKVGGEKLLIGRYGISTWGHWLGELLPKVLLAEKAFPNRFAYVLPIHTIDGLRPNTIWSSIEQSLRTYGIGLDRVFATYDTCNYEFDSLYGLTPVWSDHMIHPAASEALREGVKHLPPARHRRLAVIRDPRFGRIMTNADEVYRILEDSGFVARATGALDFVEQVSAFKGADVLFGVLGSDLANLVFSPHGVDLITVAPDVFGDRFFYALVLDRFGRMADLRGPVVEHNSAVGHKSSFRVSPDIVEATLNNIEYRTVFSGTDHEQTYDFQELDGLVGMLMQHWRSSGV